MKACIDNNSFLFNLDRVEILKETIIELKNNLNYLDEELNKTLIKLNNKITQIEESPLYDKDVELQIMKKDLAIEIEAQKVLYEYKREYIMKQLNLFEEMYKEVSNKTVIVKGMDLKEELEDLTESKIYSNLSIDIVSSNNGSLHKIMKENKKNIKYMNLTISDKKKPEYDMEQNKILYTMKFPIEFDEIDADGVPLYKHINLKHEFSDDARRYTSLNIDSIDNINLKFKLGDLVKEDSDTFKPVKLLRDAICNIKSREIKKDKQKVKRI